MDLMEVNEEPNQEQLKKELQDLLDSQLNNDTKDVKVEVKEEVDGDEPSKGFTSSEIHAFINNQLRKQSQGKSEETSETSDTSTGPTALEVATAQSSQRQMIEEELEPEGEENIGGQHLILVTQNGDKIILIQNSNGTLDEEGNSQVDASNLVGAICEDETRGLENTASYQPSVDMDEQEELQVQMQHKVRQQMFLMQLEKLREKHKERNLNENNTVTSDEQQFSDSNSWYDLDFVKNDSPGGKSSNRKGEGRRNRTGLNEKNVINAKWVSHFDNCLEKAFSFVKRRRERLEELGKFFPSASSSFDSRRQRLRDQYLKMELNIERLQNTLIKDLNYFEVDLKTFVSDFHLESLASQIEEDDEKEDQDLSNTISNLPSGYQSYLGGVKTTHLPLDSSLNNIKLITPSDITITSTVDSEREPSYLSKQSVSSDFTHDLDPVPEIRDVNYDEPFSENEKDHFEYNDVITKEYKKFSIKKSDIKPLVTVKPASIEKASGIQRLSLSSASGPKIAKMTRTTRNSKRLASSSSEESQSSRFHPVTRKRYRCKYSECKEEFDNNINLMSHLKNHVMEMDGMIDDSTDELEAKDNKRKNGNYFRKASMSRIGRYNL